MRTSDYLWVTFLVLFAIFCGGLFIAALYSLLTAEPPLKVNEVKPIVSIHSFRTAEELGHGVMRLENDESICYRTHGLGGGIACIWK